MSRETSDRAADALSRVLNYAHARDYRGYGKFDALNSPLVKALTFNNRWLRFAASQVVKISPINVRPIIGVSPCYNPKGMALFAQSYLRLHAIGGEVEHAKRATDCLDWIVSDQVQGFSGACWGYHWDWQDLDFYAPSRSPNCVVTCFAGHALLDGFEQLGEPRWLDAAASAADFILKDLPVLLETDDKLCLAYVPDARITMRVMDVSVLAASLIVRIDKAKGETRYADTARRLMRYVADLKTEAGAWFYTDPPGRTIRTHDNYHTAFILDAFAVYEDATGSDEFRPVFDHGLAFYVERLFGPDGAPKWTDTEVYPQDAHSAGTAIGTLARAYERTGDSALLELAERVTTWTLDHLQRRDGAFNYQRTRFGVKPFTLMRWCNGWMAAGLSQLRATRERG